MCREPPFKGGPDSTRRVKLEKERNLLSRGSVSWILDPILYLVVVLVAAVDQVTKALVQHHLLVGESIPRHGDIRITHTFNTGSAFGLFPDQTLFLIIASFVGIGILIVVYRNHPFPGFLLRLALGMQLGGAIGNLIDRIFKGQVTDFVVLGSWPVFNLADASIVVGILIVIYIFVFTSREPRRPQTLDYGGDGENIKTSALSPPFGNKRMSDGTRRALLESLSSYPCPICESTMKKVPDGWRCMECGVREWVE